MADKIKSLFNYNTNQGKLILSIFCVELAISDLEFDFIFSAPAPHGDW